jgi:hypothetical protein
MRSSLLFISLLFIVAGGYAATVSGTISQKNGAVLPFSSILVKGTTQGVSANGNGLYTIQLNPGEYTLICQYIGHKTIEKKVRVGNSDITVDFELEQQQYDLKEVTVKSGGEDPAYAIVRKAIEKREEHLHEIKSFQCDVYLKGQFQMRNYPDKIFGKKVDFEDGDTSKRKMIFLSESIAKYYVEEPSKRKIEIISSKVSGRSNSFGFSDPQIISFYENNISVGEELNPRGFISPIADGALNFYRYKFEGVFYEDGKEINRIKVIPRRAYEPVFSGYIHIIENEWRIQSVDLLLLKQQQMQLLDTVRIQQLYVPSGNVWVIKNQVIYPSGKIFGFDFFGSFVQVYDKFDLQPKFARKFWDRTLIKVFDSANKKPKAYWDSIRPVPLLQEEARDYQKKDSLEQVRNDPHYMDSIDRKRNKFRILGLLIDGQSISSSKNKTNIRINSLLSTLNYNTVEGGVLMFAPSFSKRYEGRRSLFVSPEFRYGFANGHFNAALGMGYTFGKKYIQSIGISGGTKVFQFNNAEPITQRMNSAYTLIAERNFMKIYEAGYFRVNYTAGIGNGLSFTTNFQFQDRHPLDNLADMVSWKNFSERDFTPNYPTELTNTQMQAHQASILTLGLTWRPGGNYIELPDRKISIGSKYPIISATLTQGIKGLLGSDVDYTRWRITVNDDLDLKLAGKFNYNVGFGGFLSTKQVQIPDYQHYLGNQTFSGNNFLSTFQLAPYYKYSNTASFNIAAHTEYHLNGLLSNKIPGFKRLNCFFVVGAKLLHVSGQGNYYETSIGIENILKFIRVDYVQGFEKGGGKPSGFRISIPLD